jgi:diguanylate cyclase (GGDEF)-like protein
MLYNAPAMRAEPPPFHWSCSDMSEKENNLEKELNDFQIRNIRLLTHLLANDAVTDEMVDNIHQTELEYFSLLDKYHLLEQKVNVDEKTNLLKFKKDYLTNIVKTASRIYHGADPQKYHIAFIRFDIDDFSVFNNKYGHDLGDRVLVEIADIIRESSRPTDYVIRFGGEEFDVILPATDAQGAIIYLDKIFKKVRSLVIDRDGEKLRVTVSAGLSQTVYDLSDVRLIVDRKIEKDYESMQASADDALYEAKYLGKDRYCIHESGKDAWYREVRDLYCKD